MAARESWFRRHRIGRRSAWGLAIGLVVAAGYLILGTIDFAREDLVAERLQEAEARVHALEQSNSILKLKILELRLGNREIERAAREEYGLIRADEVLYVFDDTTNGPAATSRRDVR